MKTPEEYLKRIYITQDGEPESVHNSIENVLDTIKQAQKDAYNQALEDADNNAEVEIIDYEDVENKFYPIYGVSSRSILKLKME